MARIAQRLGALAAAALTLLAGCASTSPAPAFQEVAQMVKERSGHKLSWTQGAALDKAVETAIDGWLQSELTADSAVQIALLGNPSLLSTFEDLSIAQADLVQAGLLRNPVLSGGLEGSSLFLGVEQAFLDIAMVPMRTRVATAELEATKLRVGDQVLALAAAVRAAFYQAQAAEQTRAMRKLVSEAADASAELARRQHEAGTMSDLALHAELALASQVRVQLVRAESEAVQAREGLTRLMGLWGARAGFRLAAKLPELPAEEVSLEKLESFAVEKRLDIAAERRQIQALDEALSLAGTFRWLGFVDVEVRAAKERGERRISFGPSASIELPVFDQKQAVIARLEASKRAAESRLRALSIEVRSEVRAARARVVTARALVTEYGAVLVPARERIVAFSQQSYDGMLIGVYELLLAKQSELLTYQEHIEALRDYWIARSDLERAVGARLAAGQHNH